MSHRILALTRYSAKGASSRVRFLQYIPFLEDEGFSVHVSPLLSDDYLTQLYADGGRQRVSTAKSVSERINTLMSHSADVLWLQREAVPWLPFALEEGMLRGRKLVIDFDDAHYLYYRESGPAVLRTFLTNKIDRLMTRANAVTVGNPVLAAYAQKVGAKRIEHIYSAVDSTRYDATPAPSKTFTVGWIGTPITAAQSLPMIAEPLTAFLEETGARCILMGAGEDVMPEIPAERRDWSEEAEAQFMADIHMGLCPLPDTPWSRGKSGYKILQYFAAGRPTLASPIGIAADLVEDGKTGYLCDDSADWSQRLRDLAKDPDLLTQQGQTARLRAEEKYDTKVAAGQITALFKELLNG